MRIPSNSLQLNMTFTLNRTLERIQQQQIRLATGRRIQRPSDDPGGVMRALSLRRQINENRQYQSNIQDGLTWVTGTEGPLNNIVDLLNELKETAIRAADDSADDRAPFGTIVDDLLNAMLGESRAKVNGRYVFSGFQTDTPPFITNSSISDEVLTAGATGTAVNLINARIESGTVVLTDLSGATTYTEGVDYSVDYDVGTITPLSGGALASGTDYLASYDTQNTSSVTPIADLGGDVVRQIDSDRTIQVNLLGTDLFQGSVDVFQLTIDLKNALWKNDSDAVRGLLDSIDQAIDHTTEQLGVIGTRAASLQRNNQMLASTEIGLEEYLSLVEHTDLAEAVIQLQTEQAAYESALAATARLMQVNMLSFL